MPEVSPLLRKNFPLFEGSDLDWLAASGTHTQLEAGTRLVGEGEPLGTCYFVLDGLLSTHALAWPADRFGTIGPGAPIGELTLLGSGVAAVTVESIEPCTLLGVRHAVLRKKLRKDPAFESRFLRLVVDLLSARLRNPEELVATPPPQKRESRPSLPVGPLAVLNEDASVNFDIIGSTLRKLPGLRSIVANLHLSDQPPFALLERERALGAATLPARSMVALFQAAGAEGVSELAERVISHEPSNTAAEKQQILRDCLVQKTITLEISSRLALCTGTGDFRLSRALLRSIAESMGVSRSATRRCAINPESVVPEIDYGLIRGMVSPFLPPHRMSRLSVVTVLSDPPHASSDVAVSLSPFESLLLPAASLLAVVRRYRDEAYPYLPFKQLSVARSPTQ